MTRSSRRPSGLLLSLALLVLPSPAFAEPSASNVESARAAYVEGKKLRSQGDRAGALEKFKAAYLLAPTPITALELGREFILHSMLVEAREVLLTVERMARHNDESEKGKAARVEALQIAEILRKSIPSLTVHLAEPPTVTSIEIDGENIPKEALAAARRLNPGKHVIITRGAPNLEAKLSLEIAEGEQRSVAVTLADPDAPPPKSAPADADSRPASPSPSTPAGAHPETSTSPPGGSGGPKWLVPAGIAVGATGLFVGSVTGVIAWSESGILRDRCAGGVCPPNVHGELDTVNALGAISTIAFTVASVGAVAALTGWLLSDRNVQAKSSPRGPVWLF